MSVTLLLVGVALLFVILDAAGKGPLWPAVFCLVLERLLALWGR